MMKTLVLITNIPTPYRVPFFNQLSKVLRAQNVALEIVFAAESYARRNWKISHDEFNFSYRFLDSRQLDINSGESAAFNYAGLGSALASLSPDWIVSSGYGVCTPKALAYGLPRTIPVLIWSGEIHNQHRQISFLRRCYRRLLLKFASGGIAYGRAALEYLHDMGMAEERISIARNTVDVNFFAQIPRSDVDRAHLLIVGNLEKLKRVDAGLEVLSELKRRAKVDFVVDIVGTGNEENRLKALALELDLEDEVVFHGFQQKLELANFYSRASLMLFPSEYDIWGLVMVESLAAGVPVISSEFPGAASELVISGKTGEIVNFSDTENVAVVIEKLLLDQERLRQISVHCREFALQKLSLQSMAEGFIEQMSSAPAADNGG